LHATPVTVAADDPTASLVTGVACKSTAVGPGSGVLNDFYRERDLATLARKVHAAVLQTVGGPMYGASGDTNWSFPRFWRSLDEANVPRKGYVGQWPHGYPALDGTGSDSFRWYELRWFEHWLRGHDTGMTSEPRITVIDGSGGVTTGDDYPLPSTEVTLYAGGGALAPQVGPGTSSYVDVPDLMRTEVRSLPIDRVVYEGAPLAEPIRLSGIPRFEVVASLDTTATYLAAHLYDVAADGTATHLTWGFLDSRNRDGLESDEDATPGQPYRFVITLVPVEAVVPAGHHLELWLASTDRCLAYEIANFFGGTSETQPCDSWGIDSDTTHATVTVIEGPGQTRLVLPES